MVVRLGGTGGLLEEFFDRTLRRLRKKAIKLYFACPADFNRWLTHIFSVENEKLNKALDEICAIALSKGLKFKRPEIRMIHRGLAEIKKKRSSGKVIGRIAGTTIGGDLILVYSKFVDEFSNMELAVLVAHEFGHILDYQTKRQGHPLFESIRHLDLDVEIFADAVASYLYSKIVAITVSKKCGFPINENVILRLNLNV
ncbi:MAG: hypothetical protein HYZ69_02585 [Candidatus Colwellbacteria bacterium]|nr:hypothetical protein [Candidatus Colwellbacteria bacterium]